MDFTKMAASSSPFAGLSEEQIGTLLRLTQGNQMPGNQGMMAQNMPMRDTGLLAEILRERGLSKDVGKTGKVKIGGSGITGQFKPSKKSKIKAGINKSGDVSLKYKRDL